MNTVCTLVRSFQEGATFANFNDEKFWTGRVKPIRKLFLERPPELMSLVVVVCTDTTVKFGEVEEIDGFTPTAFYLRKYFPEEVDSGLLTILPCSNWGNNVGSASALNVAINAARQMGATHGLAWSPSLDLSGDMVSEMLNHAAAYDLGLVGYLRQGWDEHRAQGFAQNTCALWDMKLLAEIGGMNERCNGDGSVIEIPGFGPLAVAGMEDFEAYLRACVTKSMEDWPTWGMVGLDRLAVRNESLKKPGTNEHDAHQQKVARQWAVMCGYARRHFPKNDPTEIIDRVFGRCIVA